MYNETAGTVGRSCMIGTRHILVGDQMEEEDEMGWACGKCGGQWEGI